MVQQLDPHSGYLDAKEYRELTEGIEKDYCGIGAFVSMRDGWLTIERPIYSAPAYRVGLRSLDRITRVNGKVTKDKSIDELV